MAEVISMDMLRREAEKRLHAQQAWANPGHKQSPEALLQELEIHKLELEVQNEELARAIAEAEAQRLKFQALDEISPCGHFMLAMSGEILELNAKAAEFLGVKTQDAIGRLFQVFIDTPQLPEVDRLFAQARQSEQEVPIRTLTIVRRRKLPLYVSGQIKASSHLLTGARYLLASLVDITTLKVIRDDVADALERSSGFAPLD
jgi:PAS domain S-box-containing protein